MTGKLIADEVCEIIEKKMRLLEHWGVPVKRAAPLIWELDGKEIVKVIITEDAAILRHLLGSGEYNLLWISLLTQREKLERFANMVVNELMTYLLRSMLGKACHYFSAWFKLFPKGNWWLIEICDKKTGEVIFGDAGHAGRSPLGVFEMVADRVKRALAIANSL